jgi:DNA modification methylase
VKFENYGRYRLANADCLEAMSWIPANTVDLTVTSPPYDNLRTYNGTLEWGEHVWKPVLEHLFRVTKIGGVVAWIVNDATIKGSETGTSFRQALYAKEIGVSQIRYPAHTIGMNKRSSICSCSVRDHPLRGTREKYHRNSQVSRERELYSKTLAARERKRILVGA